MAANRRIAILGAGKIGESLLAGLLSSGWRKAADIVVTGRREERLQELNERHGVEATLENAAAIEGTALIVIAVKPQDFDVLLGEVGGLITPEQTVLSVAAAIPTAQIEARLATGVPVVRREAFRSPGGTTTRAIRELERAGGRAASLTAIQGAMERPRELAAGEQ